MENFQTKLLKYLKSKPHIKIKNNQFYELLCLSKDMFKDKLIFMFDENNEKFINTDYEIEKIIMKSLGAQNANDLKQLLNNSVFYFMKFSNPPFKIITIDLNNENYLVISEYYPEALCIPSNIDPNNNEKPHLSYESRSNYKCSSNNHILFYDDLAVKRLLSKKFRNYIDIRINEDLDFYNGHLLNNFSEFKLVKLLKKERQILPQTINIKGELTYTQILKENSKMDVLKNKYKILSKIIDSKYLKQFYYWEIPLLRDLKLILKPTEYNRVFEWYCLDGRTKCFDYWQHLSDYETNKSKIEGLDIYYMYINWKLWTNFYMYNFAY